MFWKQSKTSLKAKRRREERRGRKNVVYFLLGLANFWKLGVQIIAQVKLKCRFLVALLLSHLQVLANKIHKQQQLTSLKTSKLVSVLWTYIQVLISYFLVSVATFASSSCLSFSLILEASLVYVSIVCELLEVLLEKSDCFRKWFKVDKLFIYKVKSN